MPFDGRIAAPITSAMRALFGPDGKGWNRGHYSLGETFCLVGALNVARGKRKGYKHLSSLHRKMLTKAMARAGYVIGTYAGGIENWNDASYRTFADIQAVLLHLEEIEVQQMAQRTAPAKQLELI